MKSESNDWCILVSFYVPNHETPGINHVVCEDESGDRPSIVSYQCLYSLISYSTIQEGIELTPLSRGGTDIRE